MKYAEKAMNSLKAVAAIGMAVAALSASAPLAEAQNRRAPPQTQRYAVPRNAVPRAADPRMIPTQVGAGIHIGHPGFSSDFYFYRGPFGGFEGYVRYGNFYPFGYGPVPMSYFEMRSRQFLNESRFGLTIGEQKMLARGGYGSYVYNAWGQMVPVPPGIQTGDQSPVNNSGIVTYNNGATKEEVEGIVRRALEEKEREWASRPTSIPTTASPVQAPAQHADRSSQPAEKKRIIEVGYTDEICDPVQYIGEAHHYLNEVFAEVKEDTSASLRAYVGGTMQNPYIFIRGPGNEMYMEKLDLFSPFRGRKPSGPEMIGYLNRNALEPMNIRMADYPEIEVRFRNISCRQ